jgi:phage terminase large subunit
VGSVTIPYKPRPWAKAFHETQKRWIVLVLHRRAGKTTAALNHLQRDALKIPNSRWAYIAPTYKQAKNIAWDLAKFYARVIPGIEFNEVELTIKYPNGSRLTLYGADNPDSLRGIGLWGVVFDEYSQQPSNIFTEIIRPALADHQGYAIWIGTPKGKNEFYRLYAGLDTEGNPRKDLDDWQRLLLTVEDTQIIPQEELESARASMTADEFEQEWYCSFEASVRGAYYAREIAEARRKGRIKYVPYDPALPVHVVLDLGLGQALAAGFYQRIAQEMRMIDYWEGSNKDGIPTAVKAIKDKPYVYGTVFLPHDAEHTEQGSEKTRLQTFKDLWPGVTVQIIPRLHVDDGIHKGKLMFARLWIDENNCQQFLDYISQYRQEWDENRGMFKEKPYHDFTSHAADVHRYAAVIENEMRNDAVEDYQQPSYEPGEYE